MKKILFVISTLLFISCQKEVVEYKLTVNSNPELGGLTSPSEGYYAEGTVVKITANPSSEYEFLDWEGSYLEYSESNHISPLSLSVIMNSDVTVTANFIKKKYLLNLEVEGSGTVSKK